MLFDCFELLWDCLVIALVVFRCVLMFQDWVGIVLGLLWDCVEMFGDCCAIDLGLDCLGFVVGFFCD